MRKFAWEQVGGDMNPGSHGGLIAESDGTSIELIEIQPTIEYVGEAEALDLGFPFWSRTAYFDADDLTEDHRDAANALRATGLDLANVEPAYRKLALAEALMMYGWAEEGPAGWAKDVLGARRVKWWGSKGRVGWRYLADEDQEFRRLLRER